LLSTILIQKQKTLFLGCRLDIELRIFCAVYQSRFMNISGLFKPEYIYQPQRALQRLINPLKPIEAELLPAASPTPRVSWLPTSFLATINPERAILKLKPQGWQVLRSSS
jgi:hypothetical protein